MADERELAKWRAALEPTEQEFIAELHADELAHYKSVNATPDWIEGVKDRWRSKQTPPSPSPERSEEPRGVPVPEQRRNELPFDYKEREEEAGTRLPAHGVPKTEKEKRYDALQQFMLKPLRDEYERASEDRRRVLWAANEEAFDRFKEREAQRFRDEQEHTAKAVDLRQRLKEDPSKAHLVPPDDLSLEDLLKWYDEMSKPVNRPQHEEKPNLGAKPGPRASGKPLRSLQPPTPRRRSPTDEMGDHFPPVDIEEKPPHAPAQPKLSQFFPALLAELTKNKGWYIFAFIAWGLPVGFAAIWPMLVRDKTLQEWLAEHGWPRLTTLVIGWLIGLCVIAAVIIARSCERVYRDRKQIGSRRNNLEIAQKLTSYMEEGRALLQQEKDSSWWEVEVKTYIEEKIGQFDALEWSRPYPMIAYPRNAIHRDRVDRAYTLLQRLGEIVTKLRS